ncbi:MAG: hypothetical protein NTY83_03425 [Candidatus Micrarchaeota archaeon]|nr:hypothetical protein [Candidatus Micrarchaeota archaeon]
MVGEDKVPQIVLDVLGIASDPGTPKEEKEMLLRDSFFSSSQINMGALVKWIISGENLDMDLYNAAMANFREYLEAGNGLDAGDLEAVRQAAKETGEETAAQTRAKNILELAEGAREERELEKLSKFLFSKDAPENLKRSIMQDVSFFLANPARMDIMVRFMLDGDVCGSDIFDEGLRTYKELDSHGAAMTDAQVSMVGAKLAEGEKEIRAHELFELMVRSSLRTVLENRNVPEEEKARIFENTGMFVSDPRALGSLIGFMLDSDSLLTSQLLTEAARKCFLSAMAGGAKLKEDHIIKIVGTLTAGPGKRALQPAQRENALWMFHQVIMQELPISRDKCQGKVMNAAVEILQEESSPGHAQQRERKMYGLKAVKLLLGDWYERLRAGREAEAKWHFRPEDLEKLRADTKHMDPEIRMEAMMVHEVLMKLLPMLKKGESEKGARIDQAIGGYLSPMRSERTTEGILRRFLGGGPKEVARISAPPGKPRNLFNGMPDVEEVTPLSLDEEGRGVQVARMLERIRARRGVDKLPGEVRAEKDAERAKREKERAGGKGGA